MDGIIYWNVLALTVLLCVHTFIFAQTDNESSEEYVFEDINNLLQNPSFEGNSFWEFKQKIGMWKVKNAEEDQIKYADITDTHQLFHTRSLMFQGLAALDTGAVWASQYVSLLNNELSLVEFSFRIKGTDLQKVNAKLDIAYKDGSHLFLTTNALSQQTNPATGDFTSKCVTVPNYGSVRAVMVHFVLEQNIGSPIYVDDVILKSVFKPSDNCDIYVDTFPVNRMLIPYFIKPSLLENSYSKITIAMQMTIDRLPYLLETAKMWKGPISASLLILENHKAATVKTLLQKYYSEPALYEYVSVHIVSADEFNPTHSHSDATMYPVNYLRNIALKFAQTDYLFLLDADILPTFSENEARIWVNEAELNSELQHHDGDKEDNKSADLCRKCAFIVPTFHIKKSGHSLPTSKVELIQFLNNEEAGQTVIEAFAGVSHGVVQYHKWYKTDDNYIVAYKEDMEPYFIVRKDAPLMNSMYAGYGRDKCAYSRDLNYDGYTFVVLSQPFLINRPNLAGSMTILHRSRGVKLRVFLTISFHLEDLRHGFLMKSEEFLNFDQYDNIFTGRLHNRGTPNSRSENYLNCAETQSEETNTCDRDVNTNLKSNSHIYDKVNGELNGKTNKININNDKYEFTQKFEEEKTKKNNGKHDLNNDKNKNKLSVHLQPINSHAKVNRNDDIDIHSPITANYKVPENMKNTQALNDKNHEVHSEYNDNDGGFHNTEGGLDCSEKNKNQLGVNANPINFNNDNNFLSRIPVDRKEILIERVMNTFGTYTYIELPTEGITGTIRSMLPLMHPEAVISLMINSSENSVKSDGIYHSYKTNTISLSTGLQKVRENHLKPSTVVLRVDLDQLEDRVAEYTSLLEEQRQEDIFIIESNVQSGTTQDIILKLTHQMLCKVNPMNWKLYRVKGDKLDFILLKSINLIKHPPLEKVSLPHVMSLQNKPVCGESQSSDTKRTELNNTHGQLKETDILLMTKNRPLQTMSFLESLNINILGVNKVWILQKADDDAFLKGYTRVMELASDFNFSIEVVSQFGRLGEGILHILQTSMADCIVVGVDEMIWLRSHDLRDSCCLLHTGLEDFKSRDDEIATVQLRLGKNLRQFPPRGDLGAMLINERMFNLKFDPKTYVHYARHWPYDFGYVINVDGLMIRRKKILTELRDFFSLVTVPSGFENGWIHRNISEYMRSWHIMYNDSLLVNNMVLKDGRVANKAKPSPESFNLCHVFVNDTKKLNVKAFADKHRNSITSTHMSLPVEFQDYSNGLN